MHNGISEGEEKEKEAQRMFEEIMLKLPKLSRALAAHVCHPKPYKRLRLGGSQFQASWAKKFMRPYLNGEKLGVVMGTCHSSYGGSVK
jgi:hypothetical protein